MASLAAAGVALRAPKRDAAQPPAGPVVVTPNTDAPPLAGHVPTGAPPSLTCERARAVVAQVDALLVERPLDIDEVAFGEGVVDWLDPHGLWSAAPGAPAGDMLRKEAGRLLNALRGKESCAVAAALGKGLAGSVTELRQQFDEARRAGGLASLPTRSVFEPGEVTRPAPELAKLLGEQCGALERQTGATTAAFVSAARARFFPALSAEEWGEVVLAAALRAYVPAVDPHGAWAPFEEEASLYEAELQAKPPPPFWESMTRSALGIRVDAEPLPPLVVGDLVLSIEGVPLAGMPLEQVEQFVHALADERSQVKMEVLSEGARAPRGIVVRVPSPEAVVATREGLAKERVRYGEQQILVVAIRDVREDLGEELATVLDAARAEGPLGGVVLDLRGNGGGSTDGAAGALGLFVAGAPLFPMRRRDGTVEIDRATEPPEGSRWDGPVAAVVDRGTASAAEMIAGALSAYDRGVVVGERTFGKGCAQEYFEDESDVGVLRLTTLVFALPDGSPLQRVGLMPSLLVPFGSSSPGPQGADVEASLKGAPASFRGPDVRDRRRLAAFAARPSWPLAKGDVGPCKEDEVCKSLRALGASALAPRRAARR